jgi:phosphate transport system substrate-binding protein
MEPCSDSLLRDAAQMRATRRIPLLTKFTDMSIRFVIPFAACLTAFGLVGCGSSSTPQASSGGSSATSSTPASDTTASEAAPEVNTELQGKVSIDGSSTVFPISEAAASQFQKQYPNVSVNVGVSGTGGGFKRFVKGEIDISDASRPIDAAEVAAAKEHDVKFVEIPVAYDGLTIVVHPSNDWVDQLTVDEIKKIYLAADAVKNWTDVRAGWPEKPLQVFSPGTDSGTFDYFKEVVAGKEGSLRADMSTSEDDNVSVTGVSGSPNAIGFFGAAYYEENKDKVKAIPVVNPETQQAVFPDSRTIESGEYAPFSRPLFIYVNSKAAARPEIKRFVAFYIENASAMAKQVGYVPLPEVVLTTASGNFKTRKTGTHYLTPEGEKRSGPVTEVFQAANLPSEA